jgi:hypothetical protein
MVTSFLRHIRRGELAQFVIDQREQLIDSGGGALLCRFDNACRFARWVSLAQNDRQAASPFRWTSSTTRFTP